MRNYIKSPVIFIGFGRCGSSIISEIVFRHPKLAWVSNYQQKFPLRTRINLLRRVFENRYWRCNGQKDQLNDTPFFNRYIFKPAESYKFWNEITERDFAGSFLWNKKENKKKKEKIHSFLNALVHYQNRERLSFKITGPARLIYLQSLFPHARFVYIRRKPLPNIRSLLKVVFYQNRKHKLSWGGVMYSNQEKKMAEKWKSSHPAFIAAMEYYKVQEVFEKEKEKNNIGNQVMEIFYDDFVKHPKETVRNILDYIDLEWVESIETYFNDNIIYNQNAKSRYYISSDLDDKILEIAIDGVS